MDWRLVPDVVADKRPTMRLDNQLKFILIMVMPTLKRPGMAMFEATHHADAGGFETKVGITQQFVLTAGLRRGVVHKEFRWFLPAKTDIRPEKFGLTRNISNRNQ